MKNLKKAIALLLAASMSISMAACAGGTSASSTAATASTTAASKADTAAVDMKGTKISFLTCQGKFKEQYREMAAAILKDKGITIDFQVVPDNEYYSMLKVKLSTSEVPDVFEYNTPTQNTDIGASQYCEDLSNESWMSRLVNKDMIKDATDGKVYAMPKESISQFQAMFYNKKVMKDLGIENPQPKTYAEFLALLKTVKDKGKGITPMYMTNKDTWTTQIFMSSGYPITMNDKADGVYKSLLSNKSKWTDVPQIKQVLTQFSDLIKGGYVNKNNLSATYNDAYEIMGTGKAAMYFTIDDFAKDLKTKYPNTELGAFAVPFGDNQKMAIGKYVQGYFVPKAGKQVAKSKEFLKIWSDPKYQDLYYKTLPGFSAFKDVNGGNVLPCIQKLFDTYITPKQYVYQLNDQMPVCSTIWPDMWNYYVEVAAGTKTVDQMLTTFQKQYVDFMQQQGQDGF